MQHGNIRIGWASTDLTPDRPCLVSGQFYARISEGTLDPVTATAMALEQAGESDNCRRVVMVSCDYVSIPDGLRDSVRDHLRTMLPELDPRCVFINATHTHTGPEVRVEADALQTVGGTIAERYGVELDVTDPAEYAGVAAKRIAQTVVDAWESRRPGGISFGLGHATVGYNRRISYYNGESRMYGEMNDPEFSHIEGGTDSSVNMLFTWDDERNLTGIVPNVACPAQISMHEFAFSADYWHETRVELRKRLGEELFVLPQCSPAGDQNPGHQRITIGWEAQQRMWDLLGRTQREDVGVRIADAVESVLPCMSEAIETSPVLGHVCGTVLLPRRRLTQKDVDGAEAEAATLREKYEELKAELEANPQLREDPRWYVGITAAYRKMQWNRKVRARFEMEAENPELPVEAHVVRLGDAAFATSPFEYYLDYGLQIKARSRAIQTFLVQLAGTGSYLPTQRAIAGGSYGAVAASTPIGPEGGRKLVDWTVETINGLWE